MKTQSTTFVCGIRGRCFRLINRRRWHLRYPEDLFAIQADQYRTFHMTDPQVFYNREDLWVAPRERYAGEVHPMKP